VPTFDRLLLNPCSVITRINVSSFTITCVPGVPYDQVTGPVEGEEDEYEADVEEEEEEEEEEDDEESLGAGSAIGPCADPTPCANPAAPLNPAITTRVPTCKAKSLRTRLVMPHPPPARLAIAISLPRAAPIRHP